MNSYIFITEEGITYQPKDTSIEPNIENCQVIGFARGNDENEAFKRLVEENEFLLNTGFNKVICIELKNDDYYKYCKYFYLN